MNNQLQNNDILVKDEIFFNRVKKFYKILKDRELDFNYISERKTYSDIIDLFIKTIKGEQ